MFKFLNKKIIWGMSMVSLFSSLPYLAHADLDVLGIGDAAVNGMFYILTNFFRWATEMAGYTISFIAAQLIALASYVIQIMIGLSGHIMETPAVIEGFKIALSFANLGFTLAVIFIAFVTIFRLQGYETKKLLRNLIVAAVLINFSFTFAGVVMDGANVFGNFFVEQLGGGQVNKAENLTNGLANALNLQKINTAVPSSDFLGQSLGAEAVYLKMIASISLMALFNSVMVITLFMVAGLMIARYIILSFLLIIMPFAWLCWIFPNLAGNWKKWWEAFLKWNIFLPVLLFFIYLAVYSSLKIGESSGIEKVIADFGGGAGKSGDALATFTVFAVGTFTAIVQGLLQVGLLFGGMMTAQKMGIAGSDSIMKGANAVKGWVTGGAIGLASGKYALKAGMVGAGAVGRSERVRGLAQGTANFINKRLRAIPGASGAVSALNKFADRKGEVEEYQKKHLAGLTRDQRMDYYKNPPAGDLAKTAVLAEAIKNKEVDKLVEHISDPEKKKAAIRDAANAAKKINPSLIKDLVALDPNLADELMIMTGKPQTKQQFVEKMSPADAAKLGKEVLAGIALHLSGPAMGAIYAGEDSEAKIETIKTALSKELGNENLTNVIEAMRMASAELKDAKFRDDKPEIEKLKTALRTFEQTRRREYKTIESDSNKVKALTKLTTLQQKIANPRQ